MKTHFISREHVMAVLDPDCVSQQTAYVLTMKLKVTREGGGGLLSKDCVNHTGRSSESDVTCL
jgi:hypothetical protein